MRDALGHERNPQRIEAVNLCGVALEHESHAALECSVLGAEDEKAGYVGIMEKKMEATIFYDRHAPPTLLRK